MFLGKLEGFLMFCVQLLKMGESFHLVFCFCISISIFDKLFIVKHVSNTSQMIFIWLATKPAKIAPTRPTVHMHASLILFNGFEAIWALFCIYFNPLFRLVVITANLVEPLIQQITTNRHVGASSTIKAKSSLTVATRHISNLVPGQLLN